MNCHEAATLLAAHADAETNWRQSRAIEEHLRGCADCTARRQSILALRAQLKKEVPYFGAPPALRARLAATLADAPAPPRRLLDPLREHWRWFTGGALAGCGATLAAWLLGAALIAVQGGDELAREVVASHVRATLGDRLLQVASSDQHSVKPWLSARLDYSPPVRDLASEGFPLAGARIDTLGQQRVATLVYHYRLHTIDVFVRPQSTHPGVAPLPAVRGFNVAHATGGGMEWIAVSDVSADVLSGFLGRLARGD